MKEYNIYETPIFSVIMQTNISLREGTIHLDFSQCQYTARHILNDQCLLTACKCELFHTLFPRIFKKKRHGVTESGELKDLLTAAKWPSEDVSLIHLTAGFVPSHAILLTHRTTSVHRGCYSHLLQNCEF